jgi:Rps23 Pro-64 3,4-dihydroxylase Tpa1-like proline 4-hydroxylase
MSFKTKKYTVIKNAISKELSDFIYNYFSMKRRVANILFKEKYMSPYETFFGTWNDPQVINTYSHYSDIVMETLLLKLNDLMNQKTKLTLYPTYSYARVYKNGDILAKHKDRFSCEISATMNLGGELWPIYLKDTKNQVKKVILKPGDMLIYTGTELEHWREPFEGKDCAQVFLHYNNKNTAGSDLNIYDSRATLGLPSWFKKNG